MGAQIETRNINDPRFLKFIRKHHVLTLCTSKENRPWCCSCFYAYDVEEGCFIFTSEDNTRHANEVLTNNQVAANIYLETLLIGKIQGLQISGTIKQINPNNRNSLKGTYVKRFPFAILLNSSLWALYPNSLKLTDNKLGFGTKLIWKKDL